VEALDAAKSRLTEITGMLMRALVDKEDEVHVIANAVATLMLFEVRCAPDDFGKLIGRGGANAKSLRLFIRAMGRKHGLDAYVKVIDPQGHEYRIPDPDTLENDPGRLKSAFKTPR
jgi:uncharacterized protein